MHRRTIASLVALAMSGCATVSGHHETLMSEIERQVRLPEGAPPLENYARFYAQWEGQIVGKYVLPRSPSPEPTACEEVLDDLSTRPIPCLKIEDPEWMRAKANERRWLDDSRELPLTSDGGCSFVTVLFDLSEHRVAHVFCNGLA